jgi:hypothetical protein
VTTYGQLQLSDPPDNIQNIWKYLDLHRFIYLLTERKLFFTRLDKFVDPYEKDKSFNYEKEYRFLIYTVKALVV